jgi:hypothetical protein
MLHNVLCCMKNRLQAGTAACNAWTQSCSALQLWVSDYLSNVSALYRAFLRSLFLTAGTSKHFTTCSCMPSAKTSGSSICGSPMIPPELRAQAQHPSSPSKTMATEAPTTNGTMTGDYQALWANKYRGVWTSYCLHKVLNTDRHRRPWKTSTLRRHYQSNLLTPSHGRS